MTAAIKQIESKFAAQLARDGVTAEITFCHANMFSLCVMAADQFAKAKQILAKLGNAKFDSEDCSDPECGFFAYYQF